MLWPSCWWRDIWVGSARRHLNEKRPQLSQLLGPSFQCAKSGGDDDRRHYQRSKLLPVPSRRCTLAGLPFVGDRTDSAPIERLFCAALASLSPSRGNLRVVGGDSIEVWREAAQRQLP